MREIRFTCSLYKMSVFCTVFFRYSFVHLYGYLSTEAIFSARPPQRHLESKSRDVWARWRLVSAASSIYTKLPAPRRFNFTSNLIQSLRDSLPKSVSRFSSPFNFNACRDHVIASLSWGRLDLSHSATKNKNKYI